MVPTLDVSAIDNKNEVSGLSTSDQWLELVQRMWQKLPKQIVPLVESLVRTICIVDSSDPRLKGANASIAADMVLLASDTDPIELWHEIGHVLISVFDNEDKKKMLEYYDFSDSSDSRSPEEVLAEDFYFTVRGNKDVPFWEWWINNKGATMERISTVSPIDSMHVLEAALGELAELIYDLDDEYYISLYGLILDSMDETKKDMNFSYENRMGDHQYYYPEDSLSTGPRGRPYAEPLRVDRPDVSTRGTGPTMSSPGVM